MEEIELVAESIFCYKFSAPSSAELGSFTGSFIQVLNEQAASYLATYAGIEATSASAEQEWDGDTIGCTKKVLIIPVYISTVRSDLNPCYDSLAHFGPNTVEKTRTIEPHDYVGQGDQGLIPYA